MGAVRGGGARVGVGVTSRPGSEALHYPEDASVAAYPRTKHREQVGRLGKDKG